MVTGSTSEFHRTLIREYFILQIFSYAHKAHENVIHGPHFEVKCTCLFCEILDMQGFTAL